VPTAANEAARQFRERHDAVDFLAFSNARRLCRPGVRPTSTTIALRLRVPGLERIEIAVNKCDVPYQSLINPLRRRSARRDR
jgi:predicted DNA binding CopG/RHH family protein